MCRKPSGLCPMFINPKTGVFGSPSYITFGARTDSYYEYLFKQWIQTGKKTDWLKYDYMAAMESMHKNLYRYSEPNKYAFVGELVHDRYSPKMDHLVCFLPGTLALGTLFGMPPEHMDYAKELGRTCYQMYNTTSGLAPEITHFNMMPGTTTNDLIIKPLDAHSLLRPEAVEAWFYLYHLTGDKTYQEWGWNFFQSLKKNARTTYGYASVSNVKKVPTTKRDSMESFFLAETMKYLYLLMGNSTGSPSLPLTEWVFNTEAHPLPIYAT